MPYSPESYDPASVTFVANADGTVTIRRPMPLEVYPPDHLASELAFLGHFLGQNERSGGGFTVAQLQDLGRQIGDLMQFVATRIGNTGLQPDRPVVQVNRVFDAYRVFNEAEAHRAISARAQSRLQDMPVAAVEPPVVPDGNADMVAIIRRRIQILRESAQTADSQTLFSIVADITRLDEEAYQYEVRSVIALREAELANTNTGGERREAVAAELEAYRNLLRN